MTFPDQAFQARYHTLREAMRGHERAVGILSRGGDLSEES